MVLNVLRSVGRWVRGHQSALAWFVMGLTVAGSLWFIQHQSSLDREQDARDSLRDRRMVYQLCNIQNNTRGGIRQFIDDLIPPGADQRADRIRDLADQRFAEFDCPPDPDAG